MKKWGSLLFDILGIVLFVLLLIFKIFEKDIPNSIYCIVLICEAIYFALRIWRRSKSE